MLSKPLESPRTNETTGPLVLSHPDLDGIICAVWEEEDQTEGEPDSLEHYEQMKRLRIALNAVSTPYDTDTDDNGRSRGWDGPVPEYVLLTPDERDLVRRLLVYATQGPIFDRVARPLDLSIAELFRLRDISGIGPSVEGNEE